MTPDGSHGTQRQSRTSDVLIIGAGQAGLAVARELLGCGIAVRMVDAGERIGSSWRRRWEGLQLFSTRAYSSLPGLPMPGNPEGYPDKDEVADYLADYAAMLSPSLGLGRRVVRLDRSQDLFTAIMADGARQEARSVVVATGAFQHPFVPQALSQSLSSDIVQMHVQDLDFSALRHGPTVVIGGGASGRQIVRKVAPFGEVWLSIRSKVLVQPRRVLGLDTMKWMDRLGFLWAAPDTLRGRMAASSMAFPGREYSDRQLRRAGVRIVGAALRSVGRRIAFGGGTEGSFANVIWATGYHSDDGWISVPQATGNGVALHDHGISPVPGLFFIGREFQTCRASSLLCGVGRDAAFIASRIATFLWNRSVDDGDDRPSDPDVMPRHGLLPRPALPVVIRSRRNDGACR